MLATMVDEENFYIYTFSHKMKLIYLNANKPEKYTNIPGIVNFMAPFYGWASTASRLEPLRGGSLLFTTKKIKNNHKYWILFAVFPELPQQPNKNKAKHGNENFQRASW